MKSPADRLLDQILSADWAALLVVDVQNDFCHPDGLFGRAGFDLSGVHSAVDRLEQLIADARDAGVPVIFIRIVHDIATNSDAWIHRNAQHRADACVAGTWGAEFYRLQPMPDDVVITKRRYSPFVGTDLEYVLRAAGRRSLLVTGVATNICVEQTLRDGFMQDYHVVLVEDCAGAYHPNAHSSTVENVKAFLGRVVDLATVRHCWRQRSRSLVSPAGDHQNG
jgi:ureidoacrylate peracid hydrolase